MTGRRGGRTMSRTNVCRVKNAMKLGICSCRTSREKWREICREKYWALSELRFLEKRSSKLSPEIHGIFHDNFHARFQEKISGQHFCAPCKDEQWNERRKFCAVPRFHPCVPFVVLRLKGWKVQTEGLLDFQGRAAITSIAWWNLPLVIVSAGSIHHVM